MTDQFLRAPVNIQPSIWTAHEVFGMTLCSVNRLSIVGVSVVLLSMQLERL